MTKAFHGPFWDISWPLYDLLAWPCNVFLGRSFSLGHNVRRPFWGFLEIKDRNKMYLWGSSVHVDLLAPESLLRKRNGSGENFCCSSINVSHSKTLSPFLRFLKKWEVFIRIFCPWNIILRPFVDLGHSDTFLVLSEAKTRFSWVPQYLTW